MSRGLLTRPTGPAPTPTPGRRPSALRCLVVWAAATVLLGSVATLCTSELLGTLGQSTDRAVAAEQAVVLVASAAGAWACVHVWLLTSLTVVELLRSSTRSDGAPAVDTPTTGVVRRLTLLACGVAVSAGAALPSYAAEPPRPEPTSELAVLDGLPYPDRASTQATDGAGAGRDAEPVEVRHEQAGPAATARTEPRTEPRTQQPRTQQPRTQQPRSPSAERTVRPGDTLWAIASDLTGNADATTVARRVHELHRANRSVVGDDPDLILPGQRLRVRPTTDRHSADQSSTADRSQEGPR